MAKLAVQRPLPGVEIRLIDLVFGSHPVDERIVARYQGRGGEVFVHCLTHDTLLPGHSWNWAQSTAAEPQTWCDGCKPVAAAQQDAADEGRRQAPLVKAFRESDAQLQERVRRYRAMARRRYPADIDAALERATDLQINAAHGVCESATSVILAMIEARYGQQDRELVTALVDRRLVTRANRAPAAAIEAVQAADDLGTNVYAAADRVAAMLRRAEVPVPLVELGLVGASYHSLQAGSGTYAPSDTGPWTGETVRKLSRLLQLSGRARATMDPAILP
ncbi:hypothetical protein F4553_008070 [Allocatelliglobosispora scoriae]|uniref:Uncharacterized protein n=1 Tax=Allocatelliglobosispora scoriae TaxID=643052 RepID=A0A841C3X3_9ACTN|nr:hypothetical protein [Allocatelliglobosispora scoriae]MBB5874636.1 hypothetical protein [Allocatelliglobosispora scoriae]